MALAYIGQIGTCNGTTQIDLDGAAITSPDTHRTHQTALSGGDIVDGKKYIWSVENSGGDVALIEGTYNDAVTDNISGIIVLDTNGASPLVNAVVVNVVLIGESVDDFICIALGDETSGATTGVDVVNFRMPYGFELKEVRASAVTAPVGSTIILAIEQNGISILSTLLSIDAGEKTSTTAASAAVISTSTLIDDAEISINIDQVGSTTAGAGLKVTLIGRKAQ